MQTHFAEGFPAGDSTLTQWVDAGLAPIDRVSVILLCNDSEDDRSYLYIEPSTLQGVYARWI